MSESKRHKRQPTKQELATFRVLADMGVTPHAIGQQSTRDPKTVRKWLKSDVYQSDPELNILIDVLKKKELDDLYLLGAKGRERLHELMDSGETKMIETIALVDRTFQQRRLLEGGTTANVGVLGRLILEAEHNLGDVPVTDDKLKRHDSGA